uniref:YadA C-terminal domain-containing protein n=1 Tax=Proteus mirabilis TaxID=584 RepID=UPI001F219F19
FGLKIGKLSHRTSIKDGLGRHIGSCGPLNRSFLSDNNEKIYNEIQKEKEFIINDTKNQINENNNTIKSYIDNTNSLTLKKSEEKANELANNAEKKANQYTDNQLSKSENNIKDYTNSKIIEIENKGKSYTDFKVNEHNDKVVAHIDNTKNEILISTDDKVNKSETNANHYTDSEIAKIASGIDNIIIQNNKKITREREKYITQKESEYINTTNTIINERDESLRDYIEQSRKDSILVANQYTNEKIKNIFIDNKAALKNMDNKIDKADKRASAGVASVAAMANIPYVTDRTFSLGVGVGNYRNANALATGAQYQIIDNAVIRVSASWNTEDRAVVGGGISYGW